MIVLAPNEQILATYDVFCKFGKSIIYITNRRLAIEGLKVGLFLTLNHQEVLGLFQVGPKSAKLSWSEGSSLVEFVIYGSNIGAMCEKFTKLNPNYGTNYRQNYAIYDQTNSSQTRFSKNPEQRIDFQV